MQYQRRIYFNLFTLILLDLNYISSNSIQNNNRGFGAFVPNFSNNLINHSFSYGKQVVTLGPSSNNYGIIKDLLDCGVNVFRLNFSHGNRLSKVRMVQLIKMAEKESNKLVAILGDIQGPKIRIGRFAPNVNAPGISANSPAAEFAMLEKGQKFVLDTYQVAGDANRVELPYKEIIKLLKPGHHITLDDGNLRLVVTSASNIGDDYIVETKVLNNGKISSKKGFSCPDVIVPVEIFSEKDIKDMAICLAMDFDLLGISFVQTHKDMIYTKNIISHFNKFEKRTQLIEKLKSLGSKLVNMEESQVLNDTDAELEQLLSEFYGSIPSMDKKSVKYDNKIGLIPKIERQSALNDFHNIMRESDGVMIARGDLGVEIDLTSIAAVQKRLAHISRFVHRKPCIVATQMLESMIKNPMPTRAEVTDVGNAIYDGADAVMLSAESASGKYPIDAVLYQRRIINNTVADYNYYFMLKALAASISSASNPCTEGNNLMLTSAQFNGIYKQISIDQTYLENEIASNKLLSDIVHKINEITAKHTVGAIAVFTNNVIPVNWIASSRIGIPIFAFVPECISRILQLTWSVNPIIFNTNEFDIAKETSIQYKSVLNVMDNLICSSDVNQRAMDILAVEKAKQVNTENVLVVSPPNPLTNPSDSFYLKLISCN
ncbi:pyruvate kinase [Babesia microti strain RI]|uniref:pyruvate kinase n=1 Tax=Babesia microti (strain RI) TaxID=1133968 RepID=I7J5L0_BABMR|nr:pyruvate kinase [Babesia microti strain RI]CCF72982.1 pyruvate kinase [Babesia microti strain RI]|eukprot:XP_012647591.1 pyruvate kinase [Babesia microti strain RI]